MRPTVLAVVSDLHCGSSTALCPPTVTLDDGGVYAASKAQRWLWESWLVFWRRAASLCKQHNARLIFVHNGDLTEGEHHGTTQILSGNPTAQADVVNAAMKAPLALKPGAFFFLRGAAPPRGKVGLQGGGRGGWTGGGGAPGGRPPGRGAEGPPVP